MRRSLATLRHALSLTVLFGATPVLSHDAGLGAQQPADTALTRLLRYPDIHADRIAFVYGGDIWIVGSEGGLARRLTSHEGLELYPAESRLMDEANQFHLYCMHPKVKLPFGQQERTHITPEEYDVTYADKDPSERPVQRAFEDHHGAEGCAPEGVVPWPLWALRVLKVMGFPIGV